MCACGVHLGLYKESHVEFIFANTAYTVHVFRDKHALMQMFHDACVFVYDTYRVLIYTNPFKKYINTFVTNTVP